MFYVWNAEAIDIAERESLRSGGHLYPFYPALA